MQPIYLEKLDKSLGLEDPLEMDCRNKNDSQKREKKKKTSYANENVDYDFS